MKRSHLTIEGYYVKALSFAVTPKHEDRPNYMAWTGYHFQPESTYQPDPFTFDVYAEISQNKHEPNRWMYEIEIKSPLNKNKKRNIPYTFDISLVGYFRIDGEHTQEHINLLIYVNAPAVLYSAAREILATATGRGPYPAIMLPSVTFIDALQESPVESAKRILPTEEKRIIAKRPAKKGARKRASKKAAK